MSLNYYDAWSTLREFRNGPTFLCSPILLCAYSVAVNRDAVSSRVRDNDFTLTLVDQDFPQGTYKSFYLPLLTHPDLRGGRVGSTNSHVTSKLYVSCRTSRNHRVRVQSDSFISLRCGSSLTVKENEGVTLVHSRNTCLKLE